MSDQKPNTDDIFAKIRGGAAKPDSAAETPAAETPKDSAPAASSGSPLDMIRGAGAAKPAAASGSPLDKIRGGGAGGAKNPAAASGSPLDMIRGGGAGAAKKPAGAGGTPLDMIRGGSAGGGKSPAVKTQPAAAKAVDPAKAAGMSAAEMIQAARKGGVVVDPATGQVKAEPKKVVLPAKPLAKPPVAGKPAAAKGGSGRRDMLAVILGVVCSPIVWGWGSLISATAASGLGMARFMMPNVLVEPPTRFKIGPPSDYGFGTVSTKWKAQFGVWIVNSDVDGIRSVYALSTVCTHLGCTPNWLEGEQKFKCPCHGSGFYKSGVNFEGPAPRPLERHGIRLAEDGMLEVDKSVKFQKELGQWENAACFVTV